MKAISGGAIQDRAGGSVTPHRAAGAVLRRVTGAGLARSAAGFAGLAAAWLLLAPTPSFAVSTCGSWPGPGTAYQTDQYGLQWVSQGDVGCSGAPASWDDDGQSGNWGGTPPALVLDLSGIYASVGPVVSFTATGGDGGSGSTEGGAHDAGLGGSGGSGGDAGWAINNTLTLEQGGQITANSGDYAIWITGTGGTGGSAGRGYDQGTGGIGGRGAITTVTIDGIVSGGLIYVQAQGGDGGYGDDYSSDAPFFGDAANGGAGGAGGPIFFSLSGSSAGVEMFSPGGAGGRGGEAGLSGEAIGSGGSAGDGGDGGTVTATLYSGSSMSGGLVAGSAGGVGGNGGSADSGAAEKAGQGGNGGNGQTIDITVQQGATIDAASAGITAYSNGNVGGDGGNGDWHGGRAGSGGDGGQITINTAGTITTTGDGNDGIFAQSVGGSGGGGGGASGIVYAKGGEGNAGGSGNWIWVNGSGGAISTSGDYASGITAQSIGGGGGKGGDSQVGSLDFAYAVGGNGGIGGVGLPVIINNTVNGGGTDITTTGDMAPGIVAQSIGGGGGVGGSVNGIGLGAFTLTIGGNGGSGATASGVNVFNDGIISTSGMLSHGIVVQSIGGGGGNGGSAVSGNANIGFSASVAVGGNGGTGGDSTQIGVGGLDDNGNWIATQYGVTNSNQIMTSGSDAYGIKAQSIGGGGGEGGSSVAKAVAFGADLGEVEIPALTMTASIGGSGGAGGNGGSVYLQNQGLIMTSGDGSTGVVAQAIGGGGGNGGDSSAASYAFAAGAPSLSASVALGGSGGAAGLGGSLDGSAVLGSWVDNSGLIVTTGESAYGIFAQSVGGGGGNGGTGDAAAKLLPNDSDSPGLSIGVTLGGTGGLGNVGGMTQVSNSGGIVTLGDGARAIHAQSIGGGGGNGGGGAATGSGNLKFVVTVGGDAGIGNDGSDVTVSNSGAIVTFGADAQGVYAQSVGGGGGVGGKAASSLAGAKNTGSGGNGNLSDGLNAGFNIGLTQDSSNGQYGDGQLQTNNDHGSVINIARSILGLGATGGDESDSDALNDMSEAGGDADDGSESESLSAYVAIGGIGGSGGDGGNVNVTNALAGDIGTVGHMSEAIFAQSIGGGGGKGGAASASATGGTLDIALGVGGDGGASGIGGTVAVTNSGDLTTIGSMADGIVAQSIGGGGGIGGMAGSKTGLLHGLPVSIGGAGGANGDSGTVTVYDYGDILTRSQRSIGVVAQSVAGGGGIVKTLSTDDYNNQGGGADPIGDSFQIGLTFGGPGGSSGDAGPVGVSIGTAATPTGSITTAGRNAYGVVAQSIGGGGGLVVGGTPTGTSFFKGDTDSSAVQTGDGSTVGVDVFGSIATTGDGAFGIVAQSIGGGGGFGGDTAASQTLVGFTQGPGTHSGSGKEVVVTVEAGGSVTTSGVNSTAIFAQSIGGGGGRITSDVGAVNGWTGGSGSGGPVYVTVNGTVQATGGWSNAIYASSEGQSVGAVTINVGADGYVESSSDVGQEGAAILYDWGSGNVLNNSGHVLGPMAIAARLTGVDVNNYGWIAGDIDVNGGTITNTGSGTLFTRNYVNAGQINNPGTLWVGTTDGVFQTSQINAPLASTGAIVMDVDFVNQQNDALVFNDTTTLSGGLIVNPITLLKNQTVTLMQGSDLTISSFGVRDWGDYLFTYTGEQVGSNYSVTPGTAYLANPPGTTLTSAEQSVATALQSHWDSEQATGLSESFAQLAGISSPADYTQALDTLNGSLANVVGASAHLVSRNFVTHMNSCPVFQGDSMVLREQDCVWAKLYGDWSELDNGAGEAGFTESGQTYQIGGQREFDPGWFLGGSVAYRNSSFSGAGNNPDSVSADSFMAGAILKRQWDNWLVSGAVDAGYGSYDITRYLAYAGVTDIATASTNSFYASAHSRIAYEMPLQNFYVKPYLDLQATYVSTSAYTEAGNSPLVLDIAGQSDVKFMASPMLEIGTLLKLGDGIVLRPFLSGGATFYDDNGWAADATFDGGAEAAGTFNADMLLPDVVGKVSAGVELVGSDKVQLRVEYDGEFGDSYQAHGGLLKAGYLF